MCVHTNKHIKNSVYRPVFLVCVQPCSLAGGAVVPSSWLREEAHCVWAAENSGTSWRSSIWCTRSQSVHAKGTLHAASMSESLSCWIGFLSTILLPFTIFDRVV